MDSNFLPMMYQIEIKILYQEIPIVSPYSISKSSNIYNNPFKEINSPPASDS